MRHVLTVSETRQAEAQSDERGHTYDMMMDNAGKAIALRCSELLGTLSQPKITVLIGKGNNGGDGLVAAYYLLQNIPSAKITLVCLADRATDPLLTRVVSQCNIINLESDEDYEHISEKITSTDMIIDALFGIGIKLPLREKASILLKSVKQSLGDKHTPSLYPLVQASAVNPEKQPIIVAVDCPSGVDCDTGEADETTLKADETITFIGAKPGLFEFPGAKFVGNLTIATINVPDDIEILQSAQHHVIDHTLCKSLLPVRTNNSHKGTYGKLLAIVGSQNFRGAAGLASMSAYRIGAGLVSVASIPCVINSLSSAFPEPTWIPLPEFKGSISAKAIEQLQAQISNYTAVVLGCGFGQTEETAQLIPQILKLCTQANASIVIDADALNALATIDEWWQLLPPNAIITPHPGEMSRLSQLSVREMQANRRDQAIRLSKLWNTTLVLKGAHTIIATPDGKTAISPFKTDALAKAGSGDVLAGIIAGLLAQGLESFIASQAGVYIHGLTGILSAKTVKSSRSVIATDLINHIGAALSTVEA